MPTTHDQLETINILLRRWSRSPEQGPYSIQANSRSDGRARQSPNGANVKFEGMVSDSPCQGEFRNG
eukprot:3709921-Prorocentrum_lima.AAC.1